jgi:Replication Fork Protection Component Swi3
LHDVFPKARFRDVIDMTEEVGHKGLVRGLRKEFIEQSKPRPAVMEDVGDVEGMEVLEEMEREQMEKEQAGDIFLNVTDSSEERATED